MDAPNHDLGDSAPDDRAARIRAIVFEFLSRKRKGEPVQISEYERVHPDLLPELREALERGLLQLRHFSDAERAHGRGASPEGSDSPQATSASLSPRPIIRNYRLIREISSGAQGTVFEAIHEITGRTVAVKVVAWVSRNSATRFEREVQALARLDHPGIVGVIDRGRTSDDAYFLVMEYVKGVDLNEWVTARRGLPDAQRQIVALFAKISSAIDAAHQQGIIHRDLKPSNVRVDQFDHPRIVDFGLAHLVNEHNEIARQLTLTGNIVGSIPWVSPEQAAGASERFSPATDVYSLGVLLYESLTGKFPYPVDGLLHVVTRNICENAPLDPSKMRDASFGRIDAGLTFILLRCLAKRPAERFASGGELATALESYLAGRFVTPPRSRKRPYLLLQGALLGAIAIVAWPVLHRMRSDPMAIVQLETLKNDYQMEFVRVLPDRFRMGSDLGEEGRTDWEEPHSVRITYPFYIGTTEVTRGQYLSVMGSLPAEVNKSDDPDIPVDHVTWDEAMAFCAKLKAKDGREYRLPTEAEWEFACRAGSLEPFAGTGSIDSMGWYKGNSSSQLHKVAQLHPNRWGLYDMHGNAAEWALDQFMPLLGTDNRDDPVHRIGNDDMTIRGGSILDGASACRAASRTSNLRSKASAAVGFRVAIAPIPEQH